MLYEELLTHISRSGPCYRWIITILVAFLTVKTAFNLFVLNLTTSSVPYHCNQAIIGYESYSLASLMANYTVSNNFSAFDFTCTKPVFERVQDGILRLVSSRNESGSTNASDKCTSWTFHPDPPNRWTMVMEYQMVCDDKYLSNRIQGVYLLGTFVSAIFGPLGDSTGRKLFMIAFCYLDLACSIIIIFVRSLEVQMALRFFMGFAAQPVVVGIILISEIVGEEYRGIHANLFWVLWVIGYCGSAAISYLVHNWRMQLVIIAVIIGVGYGTYIPLIPESPRWLLTRGRTKRAKRIMKEICKFSGCKELLENFNFEKNEIVDEARKHAEEKNGVYRFIPKDDLCQAKYLVSLGVVTFTFLTTQFVYTALSLQRDFIAENAYINVAVSGALELPAYLVAWQLTNRVGRKYTSVGTIGLCGLGLIILPYINRDPQAAFTINNALAIVIKFCVTVVNSVLNVFGLEVFPTNVRSSSVFLACFIMGAGAILAPELGGVLSSIYEHLAYLLYGGFAIVSSLLLLLLPETKDKPLPNKVSEMRPIGCNCGTARISDVSI